MAMNENRRKLQIIALGTCGLVLFAVFATLNAFNKRVLDPETTGQIFLYTGLSIVAFLLFVTVLVMLVRNVLKLYADQHSRVMGTRLRTRMLWGAVLVSLVPLAFMFAFSYLLLNRAVERWQSQPVTEMRDASSQLAFELSRYTTANARAEAESIATSLPDLRNGAATPETQQALQDVVRQHEITLQGGFVVVYWDHNAVMSFQVPHGDGTKARVKTWVLGPGAGDEGGGAVSSTTPAQPLNDQTDSAILAAAQRSDAPVLTIADIDFALGTATAKQGVTVVVGLPMPHGMADTMTSLRKGADAYWTLFRSRRQLRNLYMLLLLMMTSLALFASSWLALHLSKQVTKPVEALADAMEAISSGDYGHRVKESATEELGELVRSFNHMAADLEGSRKAVEESTRQLSAVNAALEARRGELETMLQTIPNGVATLNPQRQITMANRALTEMIDPGGQRPFLGVRMEEAFPAEVAEALDKLIGRSHRMGTASSEVEMPSATAGPLSLLATVALLESPVGNERMRREHMGYVIVLENATELLHAQKQSAWKEVARRVAHEIKNPLTPISLSAEQIRRHIQRLGETLNERRIESASPGVIKRCSEVISSSVETMRALVDQFSALAEFPTARPRAADLNTIIENSLAMFAGRLQNIRIVRKLPVGLPLVMADPEALKRALGNLIDNAAEAMQSSLLRELHVETSLLENGMVEITVADTGPGLTDEMRERLFLPYFSTKQRGTGLGLAIAAKIIQEHQGTIRAEKNVPVGAKFIIELRPASTAENEAEVGTAAAHGSGGVA
ncbi:MAG TPA: ATP-binding protein [Edaphobacter sp.]